MFLDPELTHCTAPRFVPLGFLSIFTSVQLLSFSVYKKRFCCIILYYYYCDISLLFNPLSYDAFPQQTL